MLSVESVRNRLARSADVDVVKASDRTRRGREVEAVVAAWLEQATGCVVLGRNVRLGPLEVDILARDGATLVVVEVRSRGGLSWQSGFASLSHGKRRLLRRAAARLWRRHRGDPTLERVRIDVVDVRVTEAGLACCLRRAAC